jgi:hypothetical protein
MSASVHTARLVSCRTGEIPVLMARNAPNFHEARIRFRIMKKRNAALPQNFSI